MAKDRLIVATTVLGGTTLGTSTGKTLIGGVNFYMPSWARSLLAVMPTALMDTPTAAQSLIPLCELESNDFSVKPFQVLGAPTGAILGASGGAARTGPIESYIIDCPLGGGEGLSAYLTSLVAQTSAPFGNITLAYSNRPSMAKQKHAVTGTLTSTGAATAVNSDVSGTRYGFSGADSIQELFGIVAHGVVATADGIGGYIKYTSNEFEGVSDTRLPLQCIAGGLATLQVTSIPGVSRVKNVIPCTPGQVNVQDAINMSATPNGAGVWISGVLYDVIG